MSMIQYIEVVPHLPLEPHSDAGRLGGWCGTEGELKKSSTYDSRYASPAKSVSYS